MKEFEFWPDLISEYGVSCPCAPEKSVYNAVITLGASFFIRSTSFLLVTRIAIKSWMGSKFSKIRPGTVLSETLILFEVEIPSLMCGGSLKWQSVMYQFWPSPEK